MSLFPQPAIIGGSEYSKNYFIERSLRFRSSASAYLNRTPASAGNRTTWTFSFWAKRGALGSDKIVLSAGTTGSTDIDIFFTSDLFMISDRSGFNVKTTSVYRDPSAWYHFVVKFDTTQSTASDRIKLYVNGSQITSLDGTTSYPAQNATSSINNNVAHYIGTRSLIDNRFDGYLTEVNFIDGQALDPSYFGETDAVTGVWKPKEYTGSYGTNGFYLNFSDNTSTTTLGYDQSSNSNNWTTNNISLTAGSTYDSMLDVPTLTSPSAGNFCTLNPLAQAYGQTRTTTSNGNLDFSDATSSNTSVIGTILPTSGKWYFEMTATASGVFAVGLYHPSTNAGSFYRNNGYYSSAFGGGSVAGYSSWTTNDKIAVAWDADAGKIWYAKNNTWQSGDPSSGTSPTNTFTVGYGLAALISTDNSAGTKAGSFNFGQRPFAYTPPTGYKALNTYNLPDSTIEDGGDYFNTVLYTGTGSSRSVTGVGFQPDLVWIKSRSNAENHNIDDAVRGAGKWLASNLTQAETNDTGSWGVSSFDSDGFSIVNNGTRTNASGYTYAAWNWKANGSGVSNTDGSITSTVSANTTSGFSIVTYTGTGSAATVGHGIGVAPSMVIVKNRSSATNWYVGHDGVDATSPWNYRMILQDIDARFNEGAAWNDTAPTSSVFSVGTSGATNSSGEAMVAYCFAEIEGFSAFGSYTGNGSTDGPFIYTGFRPRWWMTKKSSGTDGWMIIDSERASYNVSNIFLEPNNSNAEASTVDRVDFLSNGVKIRAGSTYTPNVAGATYIYAVFAENPFKNSLAR